jgi:hypothetical protein
MQAGSGKRGGTSGSYSLCFWERLKLAPRAEMRPTIERPPQALIGCVYEFPVMLLLRFLHEYECGYIDFGLHPASQMVPPRI